MIREDGVRGAGVSLVRSQARRDGGMHPTPLRVHKIVAFLKAGFRPMAFPIYRCGAGDGQSVSLRLIVPCQIHRVSLQGQR